MAKRSRIPTTADILKEQEAQAARGRTSKATQAQLPLTPDTLPAVADTIGKAVALPDNRTARERYLDEIAPSGIVGQMVRFTKDGVFVIRDTETEISQEADFIALCDQTLVGWIKFGREEGAPPVRVQGLLYDKFEMPKRESLGDLNEVQWPIGLDGKPTDPWQHQLCLVLQKGETAELFTFVTSSISGRRAVGNLLRHYDRMQRTHPDELPVIRLRRGGFNHRDPRIGWVNTPAFAVVGRAPKDSAAKPDTALAADLSD